MGVLVASPQVERGGSEGVRTGSGGAHAEEVADAGQVDDLKRNPEKIESFIVVGPQGTKDVPGKDGEAPAGLIRPEHPGLHVIG